MFDPESLGTLDFDLEPLAPDWKGATAHIGPVETVTPMHAMLQGKTTCGSITLMAGVMLWGARRLRSFTKTEHLHKIVEASFAWQFDWRYFDSKAEPYYAAPDEPAQVSALFGLDNFMRHSMAREDQWYSFWQPNVSLFHMVNIVDFILAPQSRAAFRDWLPKLSQHLNSLAPLPEMEERKPDDFEDIAAFRNYRAPRRGAPLPPSALDFGVPATGRDLRTDALAHLRTLDPSRNNFLRMPDAMAGMGFTAATYGQAT